jgi:hypothetical protein
MQQSIRCAGPKTSNFGSGGLGGLGGGRTPLGPGLTSQLLLDWQSLIQAFMLATLSARIFFGFNVAVLVLAVREAVLLEKPLGATSTTFVVPFGPFVNVLACKIGCPRLHGKHVQIRMRCVIFDHVVGFVRFLFLALSVVAPSAVALSFFPLECGAVVVLGSFILKVGGRVMWKELNKT